MGTEKDNQYDIQTDHTYGGSKYRLSYDHAEGRNRRKKTRIRLGVVVIIAAAAVLFAVLTYFTLKHYKDTVKELYDGRNTDTGADAEADFQSSVNIIVN